MKPINYTPNRANHGSVLLVVMGTIVVIGIALAAVLSLTTHEQRILARTSAWNAALPVAEAGIEEAMSHLQKVKAGPRDVNGWAGDGSSFVLGRTNSADSRYLVGISGPSGTNAADVLSIGEFFCPSADRYIRRTVLVTAVPRGRFYKGLMAKGTINMSGQFSSDSFDSLKPDLSNNGQYDPNKHGDNGDVGTISSEPGAITLGGQVEIYGSVGTGPDGTVSIGSQASVGDESWVDGANSGIQTDHHTKDMNVSFPSVTYTNSGPAPQPGLVGGVGIPPLVIGGTSYKYILDDGNYSLSTLSLSSDEKVLVRGNAKLVVDKDVSLSGQSFIQIDPNASLELYVKRGTFSISGSSVVNKSGYAANFSLFGLPGLTTVNMSGNGTFVGTIYAPQASLKMAGGGSDVLDFIGAGIFNDISGIGNFKFHYDESLSYSGIESFVITSWQEL
jgi:hypothetical protein